MTYPEGQQRKERWDAKARQHREQEEAERKQQDEMLGQYLRRRAAEERLQQERDLDLFRDYVAKRTL